jgi:histone H3/H4
MTFARTLAILVDCTLLAYFTPTCFSLIALTCSYRRLARRGGVKRIAATIYADIRLALQDRLRAVGAFQVSARLTLITSQILKDAVAVLELSGRQTISVTDIIFVLNRVSE